jgi:protein ImuB
MDARPARTLALWCPDWPVTAAGADLDAPVAIVSGDGARRTVTACSPAAREAGVRRGQRLRDAQRRCPLLEVYEHDEAAQARAFEPVAAAAESLAAAVEIVRPGLIALDARGPARYHGGERRLADLLRDRIAEVATGAPGDPGTPVGCGIGIADGMFAAALAARREDDGRSLIVEPGAGAAFLAGYPLRVLEQPELESTLDRLGVRTLGAFAALPAAQVANRFGAQGTAAHRLARGLDPRPPAPRRPAEDLSVEHEFDPPAELDEPVVFAAKSLADRLHALLGAAGLAGTRLGVEVETVSGRECVRIWRHGDPAGGRLSAGAVAERVRWQLDGWRTREPWPTADPVAVLRLIPDGLVVDAGSQQALWGREEIPDRVGRAAERVQAMLGHAGVLRPRLDGGRDPVSRAAGVPWGDLAEPVGGRPGDAAGALWAAGVPAPAPSLVPPRPRPADLLDAAGTPVTVTGRARLTGRPDRLTVAGEGTALRVSAWAGPWLFNERWWDAAGHRRRARLQCTTTDGRAWLLVAQDGAWRVEGVYR